MLYGMGDLQVVGLKRFHDILDGVMCRLHLELVHCVIFRHPALLIHPRPCTMFLPVPTLIPPLSDLAEASHVYASLSMCGEAEVTDVKHIV